MKTLFCLKNWLANFLIASLFFSSTSQALTTDLGNQPSPAHFNYTNTFTAPNVQPFTDWLAFTVNSSLFDATTVGIKLSTVFGITDLETKLYKGYLTSTGEAQTEGLVATGTLINSNKSTLNIISPLIVSGSYLLNITGVVTGSNGGSYAGAANLGASSVPVPGALGLFLSSLGLLAAFYRRSTAMKLR
jgi:hypothetical protein